jgi:hypothetical protein
MTRRTTKFTPRAATALLVVSVLAAGCTATGRERARSAREGLQEAHDRLASARTGAERARDELDVLLTTSGADLAPLYDAFDESVAALRDEARAVARLPGQLRARGDAYFERWEAERAGIQDPKLRATSAARRAEAMATYDRAVTAMTSQQPVFDALLSLLDDARLALGNDLTPDGVDAVREVSGRVAQETKAVGERIEALIAEVEAVGAALSTSVPAG